LALRHQRSECSCQPWIKPRVIELSWAALDNEIVAVMLHPEIPDGA
jgi:hypothetical protein